VAKDRAAPFSKKHRRYWITVTGGMILIGAINVTIGVCTYDEPPPPERLPVHVPGHDDSLLPVGEIPTPVMRAFAVKYPKTIPQGARIDGNHVIVVFPPTATYKQATFTTDGTFVRED
jgi:hypothetical protein